MTYLAQILKLQNIQIFMFTRRRKKQASIKFENRGKWLFIRIEINRNLCHIYYINGLIFKNCTIKNIKPTVLKHFALLSC